jgi:hypothetical protein
MAGSGVGLDSKGDFSGFWSMGGSMKQAGGSSIKSKTYLAGDFDVQKQVAFHEDPT